MDQDAVRKTAVKHFDVTQNLTSNPELKVCRVIALVCLFYFSGGGYGLISTTRFKPNNHSSQNLRVVGRYEV